MEITIYSLPACSHCIAAKNYLKQHHIPYKESNVAGNREAIDTIVRLTARRVVPVIVCGKDVMSGFDESRLEQIVNCAMNNTPIP
ncbi:MAG TPA: glutaredoxin family protein [Candidatus Kapabacteria bacterium]|nr:glutaredoxin family protein [Candidatus Kapabacteria bacterium]